MMMMMMMMLKPYRIDLLYRLRLLQDEYQLSTTGFREIMVTLYRVAQKKVSHHQFFKKSH